MSTSQNFTVYKTFPYNVYARAAGKWDYLQENQYFTSNQTININMQNYDGMSDSYTEGYQTADIVDFSGTVLPWKWDYNDTLDVSKYCLMPCAGEIMPNTSSFTTIGGVVVDGTEVYGFSSSEYLQLNNNFPANFTTWEAVIKVNFFSESIADEYQTLFSIYNKKVILGTDEYGRIKLWLKNTGESYTEDNGNTILSTQTDYWVKLAWNGSFYTVYLSTTGAFAGEETTELTLNPSVQLENYTNVLFGSDGDSWGAYSSIIDLNGSYIKIDGNIWWQGVIAPVNNYKNVHEHSVNYSVVGSPTVSSDYVATGFSSLDYLSVAKNFPTSYSSFEMVFKFKYSNTADYQTIFGMNDSGIRIGTYMNRIKVWGIGGSEGTTYITLDTPYWVKLVYDNGTYSYYLSTTGAFAGEETLEFTNTSSEKAGGNAFALGVHYQTGTGAVWVMTYGTIYLKDCYINIDGERWWTGAVDNYYNLQGCLANYTDDGSAVTLNAFVVNGDDSMILTPDNTYTNGTKLGTVNIPSHTVYTYAETSGAWTQPTLSANGTIGGSSFAVAADGVWSGDTGRQPWKAFNGNSTFSSSNFWDSGEGQPHWLEFYNPNPLTVTNIKIYNGENGSVPKAWQFQCSDDGSTWTTLTSGTNSTTGQGANWNFDVSNSGAHKYYRFYTTSSQGQYSAHTTICEMVITATVTTATWTAV